MWGLPRLTNFFPRGSLPGGGFANTTVHLHPTGGRGLPRPTDFFFTAARFLASPARATLDVAP